MINPGVFFLATVLLVPGCNKTEKPTDYPDKTGTGEMVLVWSDEFDYNGLPNPVKWSYDTEGNTKG